MRSPKNLTLKQSVGFFSNFCGLLKVYELLKPLPYSRSEKYWTILINLAISDIVTAEIYSILTLPFKVFLMVAESQKVFSHRLKSQKKMCQITTLSTIHLKRRCSGPWFGTFFLEKWGKVKKNYDIKLPLSEAGLACRLLFCRSKLLRF